MKNKRLGEFRFSDYCISWISIALLLLFSFASIALELPFLFAVFPSTYAVIWLGVILIPICERFSISSNAITRYLGKKTQTIFLPSKLTLIVSNTDVCPPLTMRTAVGSQTHILKNKISISILQEMPVEVVLEALHRNRIQQYTTSRIKAVFDDHCYIYSFVCNESLLDILIANRECLLVVPESLSKAMPFEKMVKNVHIDIGY